MEIEERSKCPIIPVIQENIPEVDIIERQIRRWHSQGLSGWQITITISINKNSHHKDTHNFLKYINNFEFSMNKYFIADIITEPIGFILEESNKFKIISLILEA